MNLVIFDYLNKNSNIADVKEQLKNIFINIDKFDIEKFNTKNFLKFFTIRFLFIFIEFI